MDSYLLFPQPPIALRILTGVWATVPRSETWISEFVSRWNQDSKEELLTSYVGIIILFVNPFYISAHDVLMQRVVVIIVP